MRFRRLAAEFTAANLLHDNGFFGRASGFERRDEAGGFADAFGVNRDDIDIVILRQPANAFADRNVAFVAGHYAQRCANAAVARQSV